jgi:hypothetical protein
MNLRHCALAVAFVGAASSPQGAWSRDFADPSLVDARAYVGGVPVSFQFATREEGHELLLTNVHVVVLCPVSGKLFEAVSDGPFLVANLPDGDFEVVASHEGRAQRVALSVARGEARRVAIYW